MAGGLRCLGRGEPRPQGPARPSARGRAARRHRDGAAVLRVRQGRLDEGRLRQGHQRARGEASGAVGWIGRPGRIEPHRILQNIYRVEFPLQISIPKCIPIKC